MNKMKIKGCQKMMQDTKEYDYKKNNNNKSNSPDQNHEHL